MASLLIFVFISIFFFFNDTATTEIYTLSLHDALPISPRPRSSARPRASTATCCNRRATTDACRGRWRGEMAGTLYVVATPLGNLEDLSPRAAATLTRAAPGAAAGTPPTQPLLPPPGPARPRLH